MIDIIIGSVGTISFLGMVVAGIKWLFGPMMHNKFQEFTFWNQLITWVCLVLFYLRHY